MNLASPREIRDLLEARGLRPSRALGQNFLIDRNILDAIVEAAELVPGDHVLEVGPGLGVLTEALLAKARHVTAVEMDAGLHAVLAERWGTEPRLTLIHGDALELDHAALLAAGVTCLVSNLPYSVGTRVIVDAATQANPPDRMVVLVQREVAERFVAGPSTSDMGTVSVWLQQAYTAELVRMVKPTCFWPKPDVVSAVVRLRRHAAHPLSEPQRHALRELTRIAFLHRRKQMASLFRDAPAPYTATPNTLRSLLAGCGASPAARAEELSVAQWCTLARAW
jgi:16S rRNA (adenine1518-N6/adenine1519-N6)-dimethyltransferase